jgi:hypothetical protein
MKSIHKNNIWTLVDLPVGRKPITIKWVYKIKTHVNESTAKFKARLVAQSFQQWAGEDFDETYAPVVKYNTLRTIIAIAGHRSWPIFHLDVKTAFWNGELIEEVFIEQAERFGVQGQE